MHNVCIESVQIDFLAISKWWCLILEVKNIKGNIRFNENPRQLIRQTENNLEESFQCPESQLELIQSKLTKFLNRHNISIPIYRAIVFPFNNGTITPPKSKIPILIGRDVLNFIVSLPTTASCIDAQSVSTLLEKASTPFHRFPLSQFYGIPLNAIQGGVECPNCRHIPMTRINRTWYCAHCDTTNRQAHKKAIQDFYMLISTEISNRECRAFLGLRNRHEASRILSQVSKNRSGFRRNSIYELKL